jgi:hypothetical protein
MSFIGKHTGSISLFFIKNFDKSLSNLADLLLQQDFPYVSELKDVEELIINSLKDNIINPKILDFSIIHQNKTLFELNKTKNLKEFTEKIYNEINNYLKNSYLLNRLLFFPMYNFGVNSFILEDIEYINITTRSGLNDFYKKMDEFQKNVKSNNKVVDIILKNKPTGFLIIKDNNTENQNIEKSEQILKKFISVFYSHLEYNKSKMENCLNSVNKDLLLMDNFVTSGIRTFKEEIHPHFIEDYSKKIKIKEVETWYKKKNKLPNEIKEKINSAEFHLGRALNASKDERYEQSYIAIDALFGERTGISDSININLLNIINKSNFKNKISYLWRIRCALLHGGIVTMRDSIDYRKYYKKFGTYPEDDVLDVAFLCLLKSVTYFNSKKYNEIKYNKTEVTFINKIKKKYNFILQKIIWK